MKWTKWDWLYTGLCLAIGVSVAGVYLLGKRDGIQAQYDKDVELIEALTMAIDG